MARRGAPVPARRARRATLDVDPVRGDAHEHVGPGAGAELALHPGQSLAGGVGQVTGERGHLEVELVLQVVGLGHHPPEPGLGHEMVGPVHAQQVAHEELGHLGDVVARAADQRLGIIGQRRPVAVADGQVLGPDGRAVGGLPDEGVLGHLRGHAPPDHGVVETGQLQDLGHLRNVAEHVGQVAQLHHAPKAAPRPRPICRLRTIVSPEARNSSIRMYQGPTLNRPAAASARSRPSASGRTSR